MQELGYSNDIVLDNFETKNMIVSVVEHNSLTLRSIIKDCFP